MDQYDTIADYYEKLMGDTGDLPNHHLLDPLFLELLPHERSLDVLDFGCGSGRWTKVLAAKYEKVVGIDKSKEMLQIAKETRAAQNIIYEMGDLETRLPFKDNSFNLQFSNMVVHYILDIQNLANELYRTTKPNGTLLFSTHHPDFDLARYAFLRRVSSRTEFHTTDSMKGKIALDRYYEPLNPFIHHFVAAGFTLDTQRDAIIPADFVKIYPRYKDYVGLPRFTVLQFIKTE